MNRLTPLKYNDVRSAFHVPRCTPANSRKIFVKYGQFWEKFRQSGILVKLLLLQKLYTTVWLTFLPILAVVLYMAMKHPDNEMLKGAGEIICISGAAAIWPVLLLGLAVYGLVVYLPGLLGIAHITMACFCCAAIWYGGKWFITNWYHLVDGATRIRAPWRVDRL